MYWYCVESKYIYSDSTHTNNTQLCSDKICQLSQEIDDLRNENIFGAIVNNKIDLFVNSSFWKSKFAKYNNNETNDSNEDNCNTKTSMF